MDWKPPTDSLYKFLAIASVALFVYGVYSHSQLSSARFNQVLEFTEREHGRTLSMVGRPDPWLPPLVPTSQVEMPNVPVYDTEDEAERERWRKQVGDVLEVYMANMQPPNHEVMQAYFSQQRVKPIFIDYMEMTPESYDDYVKKLTLKEFNALFAKDREWFATHFKVMMEHRLSIERFWKWLDKVKQSQDGFLWLFKFGILGTIFGIVGWWYKIQRYEDRILKRKAEEEAPKPEKKEPAKTQNKRHKQIS